MKRTTFDTFHDAQFVQPGVRGQLIRDLKDVQDAETLQRITLKKGQRVIIQPLSTSITPDYLLTCYSDDKDKKRDDMPESGADIVRGNSFLVRHLNPKKTFQFIEFFRRSPEPLFPNKRSPHIDEINQFQIPDCTLLATLQAILNHPNGSSYIRNIMRDNGDGTTTVRFFDPKIQKTTYYTVTNAIAYKGTMPLSSHSALWPHVLEKAFAARGLRGEAELVDSSIPSVYSGGLTSEFCTRSLTNVSGKLIEFNEDAKKFFPENIIRNWQVNEYLNSLLKGVEQNEISEDIAKKLMEDFLKNYLNNVENNKLLLDVLIEKKDEIAKERYVKLLVHLYMFPGIFPLDEKKIVTALKKTPHYETYLQLKKCGSGSISYASRSYSKTEEDVFEKIQTSIEKGALIVASCTISDIGLVDEHAYSVTGVVKKQHEYVDKVTGEKKSTERFYIQVRNPWGHFGREYDEKQGDLKVKKSEHPEFLVELKDFYRCFGDVYLSNSVDFLFDEAHKKEHLENDIYHLLNVPMNFEKYSLANLISEDFLVEKTTNDLIALELLTLSQLTKEENEKIAKCLKNNDDEQACKNAILSVFNNETVDYFGGNREKMKERLYHLIMIRHDHNAAKKHVDEIQKNSPYHDSWNALQTRKNIIYLFASYEANLFLEHLETLTKDLDCFLQKINTEVNAVDDIVNKQIVLESRLLEINEHYAFVKKFSKYFSSQYDELFFATEEQLNKLNSSIVIAKEKSIQVIMGLGKNAEEIFDQMSAQMMNIQRSVIEWNKERKLSDAAKDAINTAISTQNMTLAYSSVETYVISDRSFIDGIKKQINSLSALQEKFKLLWDEFLLKEGNLYERGIESNQDIKSAFSEILDPLLQVKKRLSLILEEVPDSKIDSLLKEFAYLEEQLSNNIQYRRSKGESYHEIQKGEVGRVIKNISQCFDEEACESIKEDLKENVKKEKIIQRVGKLATHLGKESSLVRKENHCCSFALGYELAKKSDYHEIKSEKKPENIKHFIKTYQNLTRLKCVEDEVPIKSDAYLLMRDCTRHNTDENRNRFVEFTKRPEVTKSNIGKTIAISMLGFLGIVGIAGLVVLSHGLALPLVPILVAKGLAAGSIAVSALGLGGVAAESKFESTKKEKMKSIISTFFKPAPKNEIQSKKMESEDSVKKTR